MRRKRERHAASLIRDRRECCLWYGPGSAAHRCTTRRVRDTGTTIEHREERFGV